jgi:trk system potassium uptake protein TrkA
MAQKSNVAVIGLGRFGSSIARSLYNIGHDVLAIDMNESKVHEIMGQVTHSIAGDGTDEGVLRELGIEAYDAAVVAIGSDLVASVMSCVILRTIGISNIVARAHDETHGNALERLGVNRIVNVEKDMGNRVAHSLFNPEVEQYVGLTNDFGVNLIRVNERWDKKPIKEIGFSGPRGKQSAVLALKRGKDVFISPDTDEHLKSGDVIVVAGKDDHLSDILKNDTPDK